jgi:predicted Na+-dependent transporter
MKTALLFGVAGAIMVVIATAIVFIVIDQTGLYNSINSLVTSIFASSDAPFDIEAYINTQRAVGLAALVGALNVVILTALATVFAALYNLAANVMGGVEITLAED